MNRNSLGPAYEAASSLEDLASDIYNLLDIWSRRPFADLTPGQVATMNTILREAHESIVEAKEQFNHAAMGKVAEHA